jgi:hypothetical protein
MLNLQRFLCELMYSHWRFGTTYRSHLQGGKDLDPWTWEQFPSNSLQKPDITQHAQPSTIFVWINVQPPTFRDNLSVPSNLRHNSEITRHAQPVTWCAATFKNALKGHQNGTSITRLGANCRPTELTAGRHATSEEV